MHVLIRHKPWRKILKIFKVGSKSVRGKKKRSFTKPTTGYKHQSPQGWQCPMDLPTSTHTESHPGISTPSWHAVSMLNPMCVCIARFWIICDKAKNHSVLSDNTRHSLETHCANKVVLRNHCRVELHTIKGIYIRLPVLWYLSTKFS